LPVRLSHRGVILPSRVGSGRLSSSGIARRFRPRLDLWGLSAAVGAKAHILCYLPGVLLLIAVGADLMARTAANAVDIQAVRVMRAASPNANLFVVAATDPGAAITGPPYARDWRLTVSTASAGRIATALVETDPRMLLRMAWLRSGQSGYDEAIRDLQAYVGLTGDELGAFCLGNLYLARGQTQAGIDVLHGIGASTYLVAVGDDLSARGQMDGALSAYEASRQLDPTSAEACRGIGLVMRRKGDLSAAAYWLETAASLRPGNSWNDVLVGETLKQQGDFRQADAWFEKAARKDPQSEVPLLYLGVSAREQGHFTESLRYLLSALEHNPTSAVHAELAVACWRTGAYGEAFSHFEQSLRLNPDDAYHQYLFGMFCLDLHSRDLAREHLERATALDPANRQFREQFEGLR
jgi:tetratricopeptide (TPR) repeat protein